MGSQAHKSITFKIKLLNLGRKCKYQIPLKFVHAKSSDDMHTWEIMQQYRSKRRQLSMIPVYLYTRMKSDITLHWQYNQLLNGQETTNANSK